MVSWVGASSSFRCAACGASWVVLRYGLKVVTGRVGSWANWGIPGADQCQALPVMGPGLYFWSYKVIHSLRLPLLSLGVHGKGQAACQDGLPPAPGPETGQQKSQGILRSAFNFQMLYQPESTFQACLHIGSQLALASRLNCRVQDWQGGDTQSWEDGWEGGGRGSPVEGFTDQVRGGEKWLLLQSHTTQVSPHAHLWHPKTTWTSLRALQ